MKERGLFIFVGILLISLAIFFSLSFTSAFLLSSNAEYGPARYAPPLDVQENNTPIFTLDDESFEGVTTSIDLGVSVHQQARYIWKQGYYYTNNSGWKNFTLTGTFAKYKNGSNSNWITDDAGATVHINKGNLNVGPNYIITYSCKKYSNSWKCGCADTSGRSCGYWSLQIFNATGDDFGGGDEDIIPDGTSQSPFEITNCQELQNISSNLTAYYILKNNIDCAGVHFVPIGSISSPFNGRFDGKLKSISNLVILANNLDYAGIFSTIGNNGDVRNLFISNSSISLSSFASSTSLGILGGINYGKISNISLKDLSLGFGLSSYSDSFYFGGILGTNYGDVKGCSANISFQLMDQPISDSCIGGLVGSGIDYDSLENSVISDSYTRGSISYFTMDDNSIARIGGLVGCGDRINKSYSSISIVGMIIRGGIVSTAAGLAAYANTIHDSFSTGAINLQDNSGNGLYLSYGVGGSANEWKNLSWNRVTGKATNCVGNSNNNCTVISNNLAYFYSKTNTPMNSWNFIDTWQECSNSLPVLKFESC